MVKFGERLPGLMRKGWESKYIDYAKLKRIIENMSGDAKASDDFFSNLEQEIAKVDTFVASTVNDLRKQFGSDESTKAANAKKVQKELAVLRSYVGTNIVAATKIVKKHDKNYNEQKREKVSALLLGTRDERRPRLPARDQRGPLAHGVGPGSHSRQHSRDEEGLRGRRRR